MHPMYQLNQSVSGGHASVIVNILPQVVLDGYLVGSERVDPEKHAYRGMFRFSELPQEVFSFETHCPCGRNVKPARVLDHYLKGHFDVPDYVTRTELRPPPIWKDAESFIVGPGL